jgi:dihydroneopterin aldolase/2-amino-4-hydroxy-6-hydroxymethyldihydropteridine diphosphokinase
MDKLIVSNLEVFAFHGVHAEEKELGQKFVVSLEVLLDMRKAAASDSIGDTLHYGVLCRQVTAYLTERSHDLIETVAAGLCEFVLLQHPIAQNVKVLLKKPWAPIHLPLDYVAIEVERSRHKAYIALGSNLGDREQYLREALALLEADPRCRVKAISSFIETDPVGYEDQGKFLNAAAELETLYSPEELMEFLLRTEAALKRERTVHWGPRTIDLDILLYDDLILPGPVVTVPHPRMTQRQFVMEPLRELAPGAVHPVLRKTVEEIASALS